MKSKLKKCKGIGKAKGFESCGESSMIKRYGLCSNCFRLWLLNTSEGNEYIKRNTIKAKKEVATTKKRELKERKQAIKSKSDFEKELQSLINTIVRLIDFDRGCISCTHGHDKPFTRQAHASHFWSVGSNCQLRFNLHNIHKSCSICNAWKHGNLLEYEKGIILRYDARYMDLINDLPIAYKSIHLDKESLKDAIKIAKQIKKKIESGTIFSRDEINKMLGIYS